MLPPRITWARFTDRVEEFEAFARRNEDLSNRLHHEVIKSRMRPLADGIRGFPGWFAIWLGSSASRSALKCTAIRPESIATSSTNLRHRFPT